MQSRNEYTYPCIYNTHTWNMLYANDKHAPICVRVRTLWWNVLCAENVCSQKSRNSRPCMYRYYIIMYRLCHLGYPDFHKTVNRVIHFLALTVAFDIKRCTHQSCFRYLFQIIFTFQKHARPACYIIYILFIYLKSKKQHLRKT